MNDSIDSPPKILDKVTASLEKETMGFDAAQAIENIKDYAIVMLDKHGKIVTWNSGAETIKGYQASEIIGQNMGIFYTSEDKARRHPEELLKVAAENGRLEDEGWRVRKDGSRFLADVVITALKDEKGALRGFIKVTRDVTKERKNDEALKIYTKALEASNRDLHDFIFVASHDLQEPLRKIESFGNFLREEAGPVLTPVTAGYLSRIQDAAKRMSVLIDDLLQLTRITTKAKPFELVDLSEIIKEVCSDLETKLKETGGNIDFGELPKLEADPAQMRQLFQNLISNALKYHKPNVPPLVKLEGETDISAGLCRIRVIDNGIGFHQKYAGKIFNIFQRLHDKEEYEGTGIGLAICKKVVERHGGTITATSQLGEGALFEITLPIHQLK